MIILIQSNDVVGHEVNDDDDDAHPMTMARWWYVEENIAQKRMSHNTHNIDNPNDSNNKTSKTKTKIDDSIRINITPTRKATWVQRRERLYQQHHWQQRDHQKQPPPRTSAASETRTLKITNDNNNNSEEDEKRKCRYSTLICVAFDGV